MQPILSPSKVSVHLSSWDISRDFHFHSNLLIYIAANNWQDYIKSFSIHGWRKILFSWPKRDIIFLLSSWDIAILFDRLHRFELGAIRFPRIFFNSNTWYWDENKAKLTNFIELAILEFWCPKRTHNTKSTLLPLYKVQVQILLVTRILGSDQYSFIFDICQFWGTATLFRPVKEAPKSA